MGPAIEYSNLLGLKLLSPAVGYVANNLGNYSWPVRNEAIPSGSNSN